MICYLILVTGVVFALQSNLIVTLIIFSLDDRVCKEILSKNEFTNSNSITNMINRNIMKNIRRKAGLRI